MRMLLLAVVAWVGVVRAEPPEPDLKSDNAAARYVVLLAETDKDMDWLAGSMSPLTLAFEARDDKNVPDRQLTKELTRLLLEHRAWFDELAACAALQRCDWGVERLPIDANPTKEPAVISPGSFRRAYRAVQAELRRRWAVGDKNGAVETAVMTINISLHQRKLRRDFLDYLCSSGTLAGSLATVEKLAAQGELTADQKRLLRERIAVLDPADPFETRASVLAEFDAWETYVKAHVVGGVADEAFVKFAQEIAEFRISSKFGLDYVDRLVKGQAAGEVGDTQAYESYKSLMNRITPASVAAAAAKITPDLLDVLRGPWRGEKFEQTVTAVKQLSDTDETGLALVLYLPLLARNQWNEHLEQFQRVRELLKEATPEP